MQYKYMAKCLECGNKTEGFGVCGVGEPDEVKKGVKKRLIQWVEEDPCGECEGQKEVQDMQLFSNKERLWGENSVEMDIHIYNDYNNALSVRRRKGANRIVISRRVDGVWQEEKKFMVGSIWLACIPGLVDIIKEKSKGKIELVLEEEIKALKIALNSHLDYDDAMKLIKDYIGRVGDWNICDKENMAKLEEIRLKRREFLENKKMRLNNE